MMLSTILPFLQPILDRILDYIPNSDERERAKEELTRELINIEAKQRSDQVELNKIEAQHSSIWVAGWRPFIGWVCGVGILWVALLNPVAQFVAYIGYGYTGPFPNIATDYLTELVIGMLGFGALRSFDKFKSVGTRGLINPNINKETNYNKYDFKRN